MNLDANKGNWHIIARRTAIDGKLEIGWPSGFDPL